MNYKYTIADGVRMVGHLLEHHPTTGAYARDNNGNSVCSYDYKASCWCLLGGVSTVARTIDVDFYLLLEECKIKSSIKHVANEWDKGTDDERAAIAKKLQEYKG